MAITGDKTGVYRCTAAGDSVLKTMKITYFRWIGGTTAAHKCVVREGSATGDIIFESQADGANFTDLHNFDRWVEGFYVEVLGSGVVFVYTE